MSDSVIRVERLGKKYRLGRALAYRTFRESIVDRFSAPWRRLRSRAAVGNRSEGQTFWALKDVSFEVGRGEAVGIIGGNGAGKSTLLKILSRITEPTEGAAELDGRVGSLLEVGTGFHPELTGRENVFLNGAILGMKRAEIARKFDPIVAFAEVDQFLDTPVKHYSSGMYMRLAFAVAAHLEPEILIVDEVLAVGDAAFQKKCLGKMSEVAHEGRTVLFVSHNMGAVAALCGRAIELAGGKVRNIGPADQVVTEYLLRGTKVRTDGLAEFRLPGFGAAARFRDVRLACGDDAGVRFGEPIRYRLVVESDVDQADVSIASSIYSALGNCVGTLFANERFSIPAGGARTVTLTVDNLTLAPGSYHAGFSLGRGGREHVRQDLDVVIGQPAFQVLPVSGEGEAVSHWESSWGSVVLTDARLEVEAAG